MKLVSISIQLILFYYSRVLISSILITVMGWKCSVLSTCTKWGKRVLSRSFCVLLIGKGHPLTSFRCYLAMVSLSRAGLTEMKPSLTSHLAFALLSRPYSLPLLCLSRTLNGRKERFLSLKKGLSKHRSFHHRSPSKIKSYFLNPRLTLRWQPN